MRTIIKQHPFAIILMVCVVSAIACSGLYAWAASSQRQLDYASQQYAERVSDIREVNKIALYGMSYALAAEQAKAGSFEVKAQSREKQAQSAWGRLGAMTRKQNEMQRELEAYRRTMEMVTGDGWSGQAEIRIKRGKE